MRVIRPQTLQGRQTEDVDIPIMRAQRHFIARDNERRRAVAIAVYICQASSEFGVFQLRFLVFFVLIVFVLRIFLLRGSELRRLWGDGVRVWFILLQLLEVGRHDAGIWRSSKELCNIPIGAVPILKLKVALKPER
jgi:hypothetical protein